MSVEELTIKNIEGAIRGIRLGTKKPSDVGNQISNSLDKLKIYNEAMYDDLMQKYKNVVSDYNKRNSHVY
jgi:hypothetical protein